jgi:hypothetical protein
MGPHPAISRGGGITGGYGHSVLGVNIKATPSAIRVAEAIKCAVVSYESDIWPYIPFTLKLVHLRNDFANFISIYRTIHCVNNIASPTHFCVPSKASRGPRVLRIEIAPHPSHAPMFTTFESMCAATVYLNYPWPFNESINR